MQISHQNRTSCYSFPIFDALLENKKKKTEDKKNQDMKGK